MVIQENKIKILSIESQNEISDFIDFLLEEKKNIKDGKRPFGLCKNEIKIKDDFQKPLDKSILKEWGLM